MMAGGSVVLFIAYVQERGTQGAARAGPLQAANPLPMTDSVLSPQAASLFMPHPCRSCDFHMVPFLISEKSDGTRNGNNLHTVISISRKQ